MYFNIMIPAWFLICYTILKSMSFFFVDGQLLKAPPKVIYRSVGSDVVLSWCVQNGVGFKPEITFYLKTPLDITVKERAIASIDRNGKIQILPDKSRYKTLFSPSQINVTETNCVIDGGTNDKLRNFSLIIRNLSMLQGRTFKFQGDYILKKFGRDNETSLKILGMLKGLLLEYWYDFYTCLSIVNCLVNNLGLASDSLHMTS